MLYAPALPDLDAIRAVVKAVSPKPVNVLIGPGVPLATLAEAGVKRVSLGGAIYLGAMQAVADAAAALAEGDLVAGSRALPGRTLMSLLPRK